MDFRLETLPGNTISTSCLARTPDRHREAEDRSPSLESSNSIDTQSSSIIRPRHWSHSRGYATGHAGKGMETSRGLTLES
ncbi:hypothetical protein NPIL_21581 [Nephila pilipes]|uniref:Uncharacterized protein n=1 Tax=Nephila pilipes TaxID=299642 RepID=A0A8X6UAJ0_NEPPI|nr:hypothetical protein NPIL_21581 [Nephila pilipes]